MTGIEIEIKKDVFSQVQVLSIRMIHGIERKEDWMMRRKHVF